MTSKSSFLRKNNYKSYWKLTDGLISSFENPHIGVMKDYILYRKITRIIMQLSEELDISSKRAMLLFYSSTVGQQLHDPRYGYQIMSDTYIVNDIKAELANGY